MLLILLQQSQRKRSRAIEIHLCSGVFVRGGGAIENRMIVTKWVPLQLFRLARNEGGGDRQDLIYANIVTNFKFKFIHSFLFDILA